MDYWTAMYDGSMNIDPQGDFYHAPDVHDFLTKIRDILSTEEEDAVSQVQSLIKEELGR